MSSFDLQSLVFPDHYYKYSVKRKTVGKAVCIDIGAMYDKVFPHRII